jgi:hypothetical protein
MTALIFKRTVHLSLPTEDDRRAHDQRLRDALGLNPLAIPLSMLRRVSPIVKERSAFPCIIGRIGNGYRLIDIGKERSCSIALDLGTTNLVALLYDNIVQKDVLTKSRENPQTIFGSDIMTRMHHTMSGNGEEVYRVLVNGINGLIDDQPVDPVQEHPVDLLAVPHHGMVHAGHNVAAEYCLGVLPASCLNILLFDIVVKQGDQVRGPEVKGDGIRPLLPDIDQAVSIPGPPDDAGECGPFLDDSRDPSQH